MTKLKKNNEQYWTDFEIRLELTRNLNDVSHQLLEKLKQISLDMRLQNESLSSSLEMIYKLLENADDKSIHLFTENVERVTFDTRTSPICSEPLIIFLKRIQRKKAV